MSSLKPTKELGIGEIMSLSWELYKKHLTNLVIPFIVSGVIAFTLTHSLPLVLRPWTAGEAIYIAWALALALTAIIISIVNLLVAGVVIKYVGDVIEGGSPTLGSAIGHATKRMLDLIVASLLVGIIVSAGLLLLIVPGVILGIVFMLTVHVVVLEGRGPVEALARSRRLTSRRWAKAFLLLLIMGVVSLVAGLIPFVGLLVSIFANPYFTVMLTFFYYSMRAREAPPTPPAQT